MIRYAGVLAVAVAMMCFCQSTMAADPISRESIPLNEAQTVLNDFKKSGYMPVYVKGYTKNGCAFMDFVFEPTQAGVGYELHCKLSEADWKTKDADLRSLGWSRSCSNFYTVNGVKYHASLWVKK